MKLKAIILAAAVAQACAANAETSAPTPLRPVNSMFMVDFGSAKMADTYLTPLKYSGFNAAFNYERLQAMKFDPQNWNQQLNIGLEFNNADNPVKNASMQHFSVAASWGMMHRWRLPYNLQAAIGGSSGVNLGAIYNARNSNNPVAAKADWTVNLTGQLLWNVRAGRLPLTLRWQSTFPLTGVFFSPEYDELYYEIYLGNHSGLAHWAHPGNFIRWNNLVSVECPFSNTVIRAGVRANVLSTKVNNIVSRITTVAFSLGIGGNWLSTGINSSLPSPDTKIIYANY